MTSIVTQTFRDAFFAQSTDDPPLVLLTVEHEDFVEPLRIVNNYRPVISQGHTFSPAAFSIEFPQDKETESPQVTLILDNTDRTILAAARSTIVPFTATVQVVMASTPNSVERQAGPFILQNMKYDAKALNFVLGPHPVLSEPFPALRFTPIHFPGLF